jgi:hypothetical protein
VNTCIKIIRQILILLTSEAKPMEWELTCGTTDVNSEQVI